MANDTTISNGDKLKITETVNSVKSYVGRIKCMDGSASDTDQKKWQICRITTEGSIEKIEYAGRGCYTQIWDNRANLFATQALFNEKSLLFDGVDEHLDCGTDTDIQFVKENEFSISFWMRTSGNSTNHIVGNWIPFDGWRIRMDSDGKMAVQFQGTSGARVQTTVAAYNDDTWRHFLITYKAGTITWYVNGSSVSSTNDSDALGAGEGGETSSLTIAAHSSSDQYFQGYVDEVSIFNAELNSEDATRLYNSGVPTDLTNENDIIHWWRMGDGDLFPTIYDQIQSMNGTMVNMESGDIVSEVP